MYQLQRINMSAQTSNLFDTNYYIYKTRRSKGKRKERKEVAGEYTGSWKRKAQEIGLAATGEEKQKSNNYIICCK